MAVAPFGSVVYSVGNALIPVRVVREASPPVAKPRLLERVREILRTRHYSRRTEEAYVAWIRRYIFFHGKRHPSELGSPEVTRFLTALAVEGRVAASTQNQALSALLFLYRDVLGVDMPWLVDIVRAKRPERLPVVLTRDEVRALLERLSGPPRLMACLLYGAGLRVLECCRLRIQDIDLGRNQIVVRGGKGDKEPRRPNDMADGIRRRRPAAHPGGRPMDEHDVTAGGDESGGAKAWRRSAGKDCQGWQCARSYAAGHTGPPNSS